MNRKGPIREREVFGDSGHNSTACRQGEDKQLLAAKVLEDIASGVILLDHTGIILWVNPAFTVFTGYSPEDVVKKRNFLRRVGVSDELLLEIVRSCELNNEWRGEFWSHKKNGQPFLIGLTVSALRVEENGVNKYVVIFRDITVKERVRKKQQELMEQESRVKRLVSLAALSAGVAHEINQPLNAIKLLADGSLYWHKKGVRHDQEKIIDVLEKISEQASRIDDIVKHVRSFASLGERDLVPCSLNEAVKNALKLLGSQLSSHGVSLTTELSENLPLVAGTPRRLEEVVINLLVNAMQALDSKGSPDKEIVCATWQQEDKVILETSDNASGIKEDVLEHLFEPFFTTKPRDGMGLGLSLVQSIVESYGGRVAAFNNLSGGATFRVELPVTEASKGVLKDESFASG